RKKRDGGLACERIPFPVAICASGIEAKRRRWMTDYGFQFSATPSHALRIGHKPVVMLDDQHGNSAAEQVLYVVQRIAVMGKPWCVAFNALHEIPKLRKLILRNTHVRIEPLPAPERKAGDGLVGGDALKVLLILLLDLFRPVEADGHTFSVARLESVVVGI